MESALFNGHRFSEVAGLVDIAVAPAGDVVAEELEEGIAARIGWKASCAAGK